MPRLTSRDYLAQRRLLIEEWFDRDAIAFAEFRSKVSMISMTSTLPPNHSVIMRL